MSGQRDRLADWIPYRWARRIVITLIGSTVCLIGVAMLFLPGPALVVIPVGLGILGLEFAWARRWLGKVREAANGLVDGVRGSGIWRRPAANQKPSAPSPPPG